MKLFYNPQKKEHLLMIENFQPSIKEAINMADWVKQAISVPETIGGLFWRDLEGAEHKIELKDQGLHALLLMFQALVSGLSIKLTYDTEAATNEFICGLFHIPYWFLSLCRLIGMFDKRQTYLAYMKAYNEFKSSNTISQSIHKQHDCVRPAETDRRL